MVLREDRPGDPQLVAYLVKSDSSVALDLPALRRALRQRLPDYMVPASFVTLAALPLSPNGKLVRSALPAPSSEVVAIPAAAHATGILTQTERRLTTRWSELLGHAGFGPDDNFFDVGGHSLHLGRLQAQLAKEGFTDLTLVELFQYPTIRTLASRLDRPAVTASPTAPTPVAPSDRRDPLLDQRARRRAARSLG